MTKSTLAIAVFAVIVATILIAGCKPDIPTPTQPPAPTATSPQQWKYVQPELTPDKKSTALFVELDQEFKINYTITVNGNTYPGSFTGKVYRNDMQFGTSFAITTDPQQDKLEMKAAAGISSVVAKAENDVFGVQVEDVAPKGVPMHYRVRIIKLPAGGTVQVKK